FAIMAVRGQRKSHKSRPLYASTKTLPAGVLPPPTPVSPANGTVFSNYPRNTTLLWTAVPGAAKYFIEIQFCQAPGCNSPGGNPPTWSTKKVTGPSYEFQFVGAQPGRWRVAAIGGNGRRGALSQWWGFKYTR